MGEDYATPQFFSGQLLDGQSLLAWIKYMSQTNQV